jgi:hypothetical protein
MSARDFGARPVRLRQPRIACAAVLHAHCPAAHTCRRPTSTTRGNLELLDSERGVCNVLTTYTADYVRKMAMASPGGIFGIAVRMRLAGQQHPRLPHAQGQHSRAVHTCHSR